MITVPVGSCGISGDDCSNQTNMITVCKYSCGISVGNCSQGFKRDKNKVFICIDLFLSYDILVCWILQLSTELDGISIN